LLPEDGIMSDPWFQGGYVDRVDGSPYQGRDWLTISTAWQLFLQDTVALMDDRLRINVGVRDPSIRRDFTNLPNEGTNSATYYEIEHTYSDVLPQVGARFDIDSENQLFASLAKNMKAPPNFAFSSSTGDNVTIVNGQPVLSASVKPETSWNLDVGYRYQGPAVIAQATVYDVDYRNRMANAYNPNTDTSSYINAGAVKTHGFELEAGNTPYHGWSVYGSFGYTDSEIQNNIQVSATGVLPTAGKEFPVTPKTKVGLSLQYETPTWYARFKAQHTSSQYATLVDDQEAPGYTLCDFDAGYQFPSAGMFKNPIVRLNVSNLFDEQYRNPASNAVTNANEINGVSPGGVYYYMGAPRLISATFQVDF